MRIFFRISLAVFIILAVIALFNSKNLKPRCLTGAFLSDNLSENDLTNFKKTFGKNPYLVMTFIDWGNFAAEKAIKEVYAQGCVLFVTWEPWEAAGKSGIDYDGLIGGKYDKYISEFCAQLKAIDKPVFLRFAHEMNGDWYPWSGIKIGRDKYIGIYRHVKDIFDESKACNVKWVFSVNWEDVPKENNDFGRYYPGDDYVDYVGIDGYNWGAEKPWSRWMQFEEIFGKRYAEIQNQIHKPVLISEFSSTSKGGDKTVWIRKALQSIKKMAKIRGFVIFNVDKETDWKFSSDSGHGEELKRQLQDPYFTDRMTDD